jgi:N-acetylglucosamine-6-sulfatase
MRLLKVREIRALYRQQLEALIAVDEGVERVIEGLRSAGELQRTVIVFTSDNGYLAGEQAYAAGRQQADAMSLG